MKRSFFLVALAAFALVPVSAAVAAPPPGSPGVRGTYVVRFASPADAAAGARSVRAAGGTVGFVYENVFPGFSAEMPAAAAFGLAHNPHVLAIEPDAVITAQTTQNNPPSWGLDRIDQHPLPLDTKYSYGDTGSGVKAYIVDTGIRATHTDFGSRVIAGYTAITDGRGTTDCAGHGTHVAGTVGGSTYGVAKAVTLVPVRVLNCQGSGSTAGVVAGIDWVVGDHPAGASAVLNMSLGGSVSSTLDAAVKRATDDGITVVVAAGNSNADACNSSPAGAPTALTIGATTITDARASYSNYGACLDLFAPGSSITSDWYTSNTATNTISGTSMASPHVAGIAARYLQGHAGASPASVASALVAAATANVVTDPGAGSPNRLAWTDPALAPPVAPGAPTAVTATAGNASATVSWTAPANNGGSAITGYTVTSSPGSVQCTPNPPTTTSCTVSPLTNNVTYTFTVTATNTVGTSVPSAASNQVTPVAPVAPGAPTAVNATAGNASATVSWTAPLNNGGSPITLYTVTSSPGAVQCTASGPTASCTVSPLTNGLAYTFTVTATNNVGTSVPSTASNQVTPTAPSPITLTASGHKDKGNKIVDLSWTGASGAVDVYRNGTSVNTVLSGTTYSDNSGKGSGTYSYKVCLTSTPATCSNPVTVTF